MPRTACSEVRGVVVGKGVLSGASKQTLAFALGSKQCQSMPEPSGKGQARPQAQASDSQSCRAHPAQRLRFWKASGPHLPRPSHP